MYFFSSQFSALKALGYFTEYMILVVPNSKLVNYVTSPRNLFRVLGVAEQALGDGEGAPWPKVLRQAKQSTETSYLPSCRQKSTCTGLNIIYKIGLFCQYF